jgi:hypothetical protein
MELRIKAKKIVRVSWDTWNDVCAISGLIDRNNEAHHINNYNDTCGEEAPYIHLYVRPHLGANNGQHAYHGDYIVLLENDSVIVVPHVPGLELVAEHVGGNADESVTIAAPFVFNEADFPLYTHWLHKNGNRYVIVGITNKAIPGKPDYPPTINYVNARTGEPYSRKASEWHRSMTRVV